jgi:hypothetical protein
MKDLEKQLEEFASLISSPKLRAYLLIMQAQTLSLLPPESPRSKSRDKGEKTVARRHAVHAGTWAAKHPFMQDETIDPIIKKALADGNAAEVLGYIAEGASRADNPPAWTTFTAHVIIAMRQAAHIMNEENRIPTKAEVIAAVKAVFKQIGRTDFQEDPQRWTEIFQTGWLGDLPRGKASHTETRHGNK